MTKRKTRARRRAAREDMVMAAVALGGVEEMGEPGKRKFVCGGVDVTRTVFDLYGRGRLTLTLPPVGRGDYFVVRRSYW